MVELQGAASTGSSRNTIPDEPAIETAPDPAEDNLDDLDDVLDEFSSSTPQYWNHGNGLNQDVASRPTDNEPQSSNIGQRPPASVANLEEDLVKQLQSGMSELLGELGSQPGMQQQFDRLVEGVGVATSQQEDPSTIVAEDSFQETIRRTVERMQVSGDQAGAAATSERTDDMFAQMLREMQGGDLEGLESDDGFSKMLLGMMEQLTNKEILYEPMKELHDKYPEWMDRNKDRVSADDWRRYEEQQRLVREIVEKFEERDYSDSNAGDREFIVDRMQKMQAAGSPPADLVGNMDAAHEVLGDVGSGCNQQ